MTTHPIDALIVDGAPVSKSAFRAELRNYVREFTSVANFRTYDLSSTPDVLIAGVVWKYDSTDFVTADDGVSCILDLSSRRYKKQSTGGGGSSPIAFANSLTNLALVDPSASNVCWMSYGIRSGLFNWKTGDFTARIATDPTQGIYVQSTVSGNGPTVGCWVRQNDVITAANFGALGDDATNDSAAIQALIDFLWNSGGGTGYLKAGSYRHASTLVGRYGVKIIGAGRRATTLKYTSNILALSLLGTTGVETNRTIGSFQSLKLLGTLGGAAAQGVQYGYNMRADDLLKDVWISDFSDYGLGLVGPDWIVSFSDVEIDLCGVRVSGSSGVYKDPAVNSGNLTSTTFNNFTIEACGNSGSAAGAINWQSSSVGNRGFYLNNCTVEGNAGTDEILISNHSDVGLFNLYIERGSVSGQLFAVELNNCKARLVGGYIAGASGFNQYGVRLTNGSELTIVGAASSGWVNGDLINYASTVKGIKPSGYVTISGTVDAAWGGEFLSSQGIITQTGVSGTANATVFSTAFALRLNAIPQLFLFTPAITNTAAVTIAVDTGSGGSFPVALKSPLGAALAAGEFAAGIPYLISATSSQANILFSGAST